MLCPHTSYIYPASPPTNQPTNISTTTIASPLQHCHPTTETASPLIPRVLCLCFRSSSFFLVRSKSVAGSTAMNYLSKSFRPRSACGGHTHAATHTDVIRTRGTHVTYQLLTWHYLYAIFHSTAYTGRTIKVPIILGLINVEISTVMHTYTDPKLKSLNLFCYGNVRTGEYM